ncbi:MAG: right-handed parallel beta-helix repeat-containing protein [Candidatus Thorarchaeota archaeon]
MNRKGLNLLVIIAVLSLLILNTSRSSAALDVDTQEIAQTYTPHAVIHIDGNAEFLALDASEGWQGDGSLEDPIIITGYSIAAAEHMLRVENSDLHFKFIDNQLDGLSYVWCGIAIINSANGIIMDNYVERAAAGIHVVTVENFIIQGNEVQDSTFAGIVVEDGSQDVLVENNIVYNNQEYGIHIGNPYGSATSHNVTITGNTVYDNSPGGIRLLEAEDCVVEYNEAHSNTLNGIIVESGSHHINFNNVTDCVTGILLSEGNCTITHNSISNLEYAISVGTENNTISENYLTNNEKNGIRFFHSYISGFGGSNNLVTGNVIANNSRWGIEFTANADDNVIQNNYFFTNGETCQADDDGANNFIDANYWDDWITPDANNDSIVDVPYSIHGDAENSDLHPMTIPDRTLSPWYVAPCACGNETTTTTGTLFPVDPLILTAGISAVVVILIVVVFVKKR